MPPPPAAAPPSAAASSCARQCPPRGVHRGSSSRVPICRRTKSTAMPPRPARAVRGSVSAKRCTLTCGDYDGFAHVHHHNARFIGGFVDDAIAAPLIHRDVLCTLRSGAQLEEVGVLL